MKKLIVLLLLSLICSCIQKHEPKEIVFVCTHGAARSPIAAAYFNKIAKEQNLNYLAVFRGTEPDSVLTTGTIIGLLKDDFEISNWKPEIVTKNDIETADRVVTFDLKLHFNNASKEIEQWNGTPSISKDYDQARDIIEEKVKQLIKALPKN